MEDVTSAIDVSWITLQSEERAKSRGWGQVPGWNGPGTRMMGLALHVRAGGEGYPLFWGIDRAHPSHFEPNTSPETQPISEAAWAQARVPVGEMSARSRALVTKLSRRFRTVERTGDVIAQGHYGEIGRHDPSVAGSRN